MARLLPGVFSAINDLSQFPEGAQSLNVGYVVKADRGPVNEWNRVVSPTDFLAKYTFSGKPSLTADPTFQSIIKDLAQTNSMYVVRAANNPLYGGAIVKKAQKHGFVLGVDQAEETFLLMVDNDEKEGQAVPEAGESIIVAGTGLFDGRYKVEGAPKDTGYEPTYEDEEGKEHTCEVYEVKVAGDNPIFFSTDKIGYAIKDCGKEDGTDKYFFEVAGNILGDFDAFGSEKAILTIADSKQAGGSSGADVDNDGYYVVNPEDVKLIEEITEGGDYVYSTRIYITAVTGSVFKTSVDEITDDNKGKLFINKAFKGTNVYRTPVVPLSAFKVGDIFQIDAKKEENGVTNRKLVLYGEVAAKFAAGDKITVKDTPENAEHKTNDGEYTVVKAEETEEHTTVVTVKERFNFSVNEDTPVEDVFGAVYMAALVDPANTAEGLLGEDDLMLITGIDPGAYNGKEAFGIVSAFDNKSQLVYYKGATGLFDEPCTFNTMQLTVRNADTNELLESFTFSRDPEAKAIDGSSLYVENVVEGSAYIKVFNNAKFEDTSVPSSTLAGSAIQASGGSDGGTVTPEDMVRALSAFQDKTVPISILGNGCSPEAESPVFQQALLELANSRKDCFVFLNSPADKEKATVTSTRAQDIADYKKGTLASTSFYACMYAPHVKTPDIFNSREVKIGADSVAIAGWLNVINSLNYPYAYAGPRNGLVQGVTCDWKIGDMSGEAEILNDASVNYVAYDGKVGRYYMQCQNTLQIANSAMRNIGAVLNVLDIKETLATYLKEFINLPITDGLRRDIMDTCNDYLSPMTGSRFYEYTFQDVTTDADIAQDTLRYLLTISVTRYSKLIYLTCNIVNSTFNFSILQSM